MIANRIHRIKTSRAGLLGISIALALSLTVPGALSAKCFSFSDADGVKVCVDGNNNSARKKAKSACKKATGSKCGNITGYSGSCQMGSGTICIDGNGKEHKRLKGS